MKLLLCRACGDMLKFGLDDWRFCNCGRSSARYVDAAFGEMRGDDAVAIGVDNADLAKMVHAHGNFRAEWWKMLPGAPGVRVTRVT